MKKILVTGSSGLLGRSLVRFLCQHGVQTVPYDLSHGKDIRDRNSFRQSLQGVDLCIHLAAVADMYVAAQDRDFCFEINLGATRMIAEECAKQDVRLLFISTVCVYGNNGCKRQVEMSPLCPHDNYTESKVAAEVLLPEVENLDYRIMRPSTFYGSGMRGSLATQKFLDACLKGKAIQIHGDGMQTRCFTHVDDIASALITVAAKWPEEKVFNIASDEERTVLQLAEIAGCVTNIRPRIEYISDREGQIRISSIDSSLLKSYGWRAKYSLREGLRTCLKKSPPPPPSAHCRFCTGSEESAKTL